MRSGGGAEGHVEVGPRFSRGCEARREAAVSVLPQALETAPWSGFLSERGCECVCVSRRGEWEGEGLLCLAEGLQPGFGHTYLECLLSGVLRASTPSEEGPVIDSVQMYGQEKSHFSFWESLNCARLWV